MKSLRALLEALYSMLMEAFRGLRSDRTQAPKPVFGPALPMPITRAPRAPDPMSVSAPAGHAPTLRQLLRARAARPPLPPHLAAMLASAPDVEPEFLPKPRRRVELLAPLHRIAAKVRVYNPRPVLAAKLRALPVALAAWGERLRRAISEIHAWLAFDTAPPRREAVR